MILSIPALNWAAVRSGLGLGDFMASLTPEREEEILVAYNAWKKSKGLKPEDPVSPIFTVAHENQPEDDLSAMIEAVAEEIEEEEAAEIANTMAEIEAIDVPDDDAPIPEEFIGVEAKPVPDDQTSGDAAEPNPTLTVDERAASDAATPTAASITNEHMDSDTAMPVLDESADSDAATPVVDEHVGGEAATPAAETKTKEAISIEQRISKLPKTPDAALYEELLASMGGDVDTLKAITKAVLEDNARRHRSRVAQRQFLVWQEERNSSQPE